MNFRPYFGGKFFFQFFFCPKIVKNEKLSEKKFDFFFLGEFSLKFQFLAIFTHF